MVSNYSALQSSENRGLETFLPQAALVLQGTASVYCNSGPPHTQVDVDAMPPQCKVVMLGGCTVLQLSAPFAHEPALD